MVKIRQLFTGPDLSQRLDMRLRTILDELSRVTAEELNDINPFVERAQIAMVELYEDQLSRSSSHETEVDARRLPDAAGRNLPDRGGQVLIPGALVDVYLPFSGDPLLFVHSPNVIGPVPPMAGVEHDRLVFRITHAVEKLTAEYVKKTVATEIKRTKDLLGHVGKQVSEYNASIPDRVEQAAEARRARLTKLGTLEDGLDIPIDEDEDGGGNRTSRPW